MGVKVIDKDFGMKKFFRNARLLNNKAVKAGVLADSGNESNGTSLVDVAIYNEYGTKHIPSRPFIRIASDNNVEKWASHAEKIVDGTANFNSLGNVMVSDIKAVIGDKSQLAPNAPSTIRRKGHDLPLIDKGKLKASINYEVE